MAMQTGVSSSKVLILVGAGVTGSIILKSGRLSDVLLQLQDLISGVNENDIAPNKIDGAILAAQIRQLAQEIRELSLSNPITIFDRNSASSASYSSYLVPAATLGAMGYCYMWWKGWSFSDAMFVTKQNMANAVDAVSKQLEGVSEALASTKRHLSKHLEKLGWKVEEQKGISKLIAHDEGKLNLLEDKQDMTNSGLQYLCHVAGGIKDGLNVKLFQDGRRVHVIERDLTEQDRIVGELLQPGGYLRLMELGLEDCVGEIDSQRVFGYTLFKDGENRKLSYPLEKFHADVSGRSFYNGRFIQRMREKAASLPNVRLEQGTVTSLLDDNGVIKGVRYKNKSGEELTAYAPLRFFAVAVYGVGRLLLPFPSPKRIWIGARLIHGASGIIFPIIKAEGIRKMFFPATVPAYYRAPPVES